jgi:hypothetical protein
MILNNWRNGFGNDNYTDLLVHSNVTLSSQTFVDSSHNNWTMSIKIEGIDSLTSHSTEKYNLGTSSIKFAHPSSSCADCSLWCDASDIGTKDFSFDFSVYVNGTGSSPYTDDLYIGYFSATNGTSLSAITQNSVFLNLNNIDGNVIFKVMSGGTALVNSTTSNVYNENEWCHISLLKKSTGFYLYSNGTLLTTYSSSDIDMSYITDHKHLIFYDSGDCSNSRKFYIEEWRHSIGVRRWFNDFKKPNRFY